MIPPRLRAAAPGGNSGYVRLCLLSSALAILLWTRTTSRYSDFYKLFQQKQTPRVSSNLLNRKEVVEGGELPFADKVLREDLRPKTLRTIGKKDDSKRKRVVGDMTDISKEEEDLLWGTKTSKDTGSRDASKVKVTKVKESGTGMKEKDTTTSRPELEQREEENANEEEIDTSTSTPEDQEIEVDNNADIEEAGDDTESEDQTTQFNSTNVDEEKSLRGSRDSKDGVEVEDKEINSDINVPDVIWLMSFPNSGTTYTNKLVQGISQTTTATNYGQEQSGYKTSIPISPDLPDGPYYRYPEGNHSNYVLTKTHCGGYCSRCSPARYVLTAERFESFCRSGNKLVEGKSSSTRPAYPADLPKKAVHILRNPMDNIVARLHMERKNWKNHGHHEDFLELFQSDQDGFRNWCRYLQVTTYNATLDSNLLDNRTKELYDIVPCGSEFYRYVQWHNLAIEVAEERLHLPVHTIFYEDYSHRYNETVDRLLDFLELEAVSTPPPFIQGKEYSDYFTEEQQMAVAQLLRHLATDKTWALLERYFESILEDQE